MSQLNLHEIIQQQQKQLAAMQVQIQALLAATGGAATGSNAGPHMEIAKPAIFNGEAGIHYSMQIILEDEVERSNSRRTSSMGFVICAGRISGCLERKHYGGIRIGGSRV